MEEKTSLKKAKQSIKRETLNYLGLNKFIAMYLIIRMHLYCAKTMPFDFGIRSCEFLFISSGFLIGYNHYKRPFELTHLTPFKYAYKHLRLFYPYYLLNLFFGLYLNKSNIQLNPTNIQLLIINLLLLANWSSHRAVARFYFGISWFLDNIFYCYFLSPFLLNSINNIKNSIKLFAIISLSRIGVEKFLYIGAYNVFDTNLHCGPVIRIFEFYMGMSMIPLFFHIKSRLDQFKNNLIFKIVFTIIQIVLPIFLWRIMIKYDKNLFRCYFLLILSTYTFVISYDYGFLSYISSLKIIKIIMSAQMEMYLIQMNIHLFFDMNFKKLNIKNIHGIYYYYLKLISIIIISFIYRIFYRDKLAILLDKLVNLFI